MGGAAARGRCVGGAQRLRNRVASVMTDADRLEILVVVDGVWSPASV